MMNKKVVARGIYVSTSQGGHKVLLNGIRWSSRTLGAAIDDGGHNLPEGASIEIVAEVEEYTKAKGESEASKLRGRLDEVIEQTRASFEAALGNKDPYCVGWANACRHILDKAERLDAVAAECERLNALASTTPISHVNGDILHILKLAKGETK